MRDDRLPRIREVVEALLVALIFVTFVRVFLFQAFKIPSESMEPTLLVGDHLVVNKLELGMSAPIVRGDLVVFRYPLEPEEDFVKRVIALPGETIEIANKKVWIDGRMLDEPYVRRSDQRRLPGRDDFGPVTLGETEYFVMGDNRDASNDSRYWGPVPRKLMTGRPSVIYWSFDGQPPPEGSGPRERIAELAGVAIHFFDRTRWERTLSPVSAERPQFRFDE